MEKSQNRSYSTSIKQHPAIAAIFGFIVLSVLTVCLIQTGVEHEVEEQIDSKLKQQQVAYDAVINGLSMVTETLFEETLDQPEVLSLFAQGQNSYGDEQDIARGLLYRKLYRSYQALKQKGFRQLHFHTAEGISYLRFHRPAIYGDPLFEARESVRLVNTQLKPVQGFESGRFFHGFRFLFPLIYQGKHLGSVETSVSFKTIEKNLNQLVPNEHFIFVLNKTTTFAKLFPSERSIYQDFELNHDFVTEDLGAKLGHPTPVPEIQTQLQKALLGQSDTIAKNMLEHQAFGLVETLNGSTYVVQFLPVYNVNKEVEAYILSYALSPDLDAFYNNGLIIQLALVGLIASLMFGFYKKQVNTQILEQEHQKFKAISETMAEGLFVQDKEGRINFINHAAEEILDLPHDSAIGAVAHDLLHVHYNKLGKEVPIEDCPIRVVTQHGEVYSSEDEFFRKGNGELVPVQVTSAAYAVNGQESGSVTIFRDITQRKEDEQQLRLASIVFDSTLSGIVITDPNLNILAVNKAFSQITGYSKEEVLGQHIRILKSGIHDRVFYDVMWQHLRDDGYWEGEIWNKRKNGEIYPQIKATSVVYDQNGEISHYVSVFSDFTDRKRYEDDLKKARKKALESAEAKSEFLANMSHEIRTPMNGILGMLELALDTELTTEQREFLRIAHASSDTLLELLNSILDLAKYEAGKVELEQIDFNPRQVLEDIVKLFAPQAQRKSLEIALLIDPDLPEYVNGDPTRLRQVITNLMGNAIKFTDEGEIVVTAKAEKQNKHWQLQIEVKDTGIGISEQAQQKIFESFSQADGSTTRKYGGTGLGLSLSKKIVQSMNGSITLASTEGEGSCFSVTIELNPAHKEHHGFQANIELEGLRALIVDDNATNRLIIERYCDTWKIFHQSAGSGIQALKLLQDAAHKGKPFDLLLTDMMMPEMDGVQLAQRIRQLPELHALKMVLITSYSGRSLQSQAQQAQFDLFVPKPISMKELHNGLEHIFVHQNQAQPQKEIDTQQACYWPEAHVLLAEDNEVNRKVATANLTKLGIQVTSVENGEEAFEAYHDGPFDLVLMDCQMPIMDGSTATKEIRNYEQQENMPGTPIIAMTAFVTPEEIEKCLNAGMNGHLGKPFTQQELIQILQRYLPEAKTSKPESATHNKATPSDEESPPALNTTVLAELSELLDGDLQSIITPFNEQMPSLINEIVSGLESKQTQTVFRAAHTLKSSASNIGGVQLSALCKTIEELAGNDKLEEIKPLAKPLQLAAEKLSSDLNTYLSTHNNE